MSTKFIPKTERQKGQSYKLGDKFVMHVSDENPFIFSLHEFSRNFDLSYSLVSLVSLIDGLNFSEPVAVKDYTNITQAEMNKITDGATFHKIEVQIKEV